MSFTLGKHGIVEIYDRNPKMLERAKTAFLKLMPQVLERPAKPTKAALLSLVSGPNRTDLVREETLPDLFRDTAKTCASKTALIYGERSLTYETLDRWSDEVAAHLAEQGIGRGAAVGVWWPRGLELHVVILGIVKSGAAYVPLDRETPAERVKTVLSEVKAAACFSELPLDNICSTLKVPAKLNSYATVAPPSGPKPDDWAYVLYTSGSTGKPKGIPITHRQICHLVRAEQNLFGITNTDRVYQGFSVSFDMWCEETWISYLAGATLWVSDAATAKSIDELSGILRQQHITVLHAVPSLLAVMDENVPSLRLVNAGGEACTPQVLNKWADTSRQFFNSYGPTETTVTATMAKLNKNDPITIGSPLPNYGLAVVDGNFNPLPYGKQGELVISGLGVSQGYVNRPDLTEERFIAKPPSLNSLPGDRIYRTSDAAIMTEDGYIHFQGRLDDQVKLHGYRIELGEIETRIHNLPDVSAAAVVVKRDNNGQDRLVGYVVTDGKRAFDYHNARAHLAKEMPPYMVPSVMMELDELPRLSSGKIDRKSLPLPPSLETVPDTIGHEPIDRNAPLQERVITILKQIFPGETIDLTKDFFDDLGGDSLLAAFFVSRLRDEAGIPQASIKDVYLHRPLSKLAEAWDKQPHRVQEASFFHPILWWRYALCGLGQSVSLFFIYGLFAFQIFLPYLAYYYIQQETLSHFRAIIASLGFFCFIPPFLTGLAIVIKWLVIGRMKAGDYPLWGWTYFRWWFSTIIQKLIPTEYINGTPLYPMYLKFLGVNVSPDAQISEVHIGAWDLVTIGKDVSISSNAVLNNAVVEGGLLKLRTIHLEDHAYIGSSAVINGGCRVEKWGELKDLSCLKPCTVIRTGEVWEGSPAVRQTTRTPEERPHPLPVSAATRLKYSTVYILLLLIFPFTVLLPFLPSIMALNALDDAYPAYNFSYLIYTPLLTLNYMALFILEAWVLTRILQWKLKPGVYPVYSKFYLKKWFSDQVMTLALFMLHPIYATVYVSTLFRLLGAKVGKNTEVSTASQVTHPLLEIGDDAFIADAVTLGEADVRGQQLTLNRTRIGNNSFVGNSALIPQGYKLPDNMLVGVLSVPPTDAQLKSSSAQNWFGSPAIALPRRQDSGHFPSKLTTNPTILRRVFRSLVELARVLLPTSAIICFSVLFIAYGHDLLVDKRWWEIAVEFPLYYLAFIGFPSLLVTAALKWILVGRYKARRAPMWTWKVWRYEAITTIYESLAVPFLLEFMKGTPWLPLALRLLGVRIGKRAWLNTTDITEYDMVSIGDDAALNHDSGPQTHLFEDRVMKIGPVKIGARCSVGAKTIILYDSKVGNGTRLEALSLVMKGEKLAPDTSWEGSPVRPA